jgi:hypothetical protein
VVLLAAHQLRGERPPAFLGWVVVGVFAIGVTIITLVPLVILHLLTRRAAQRPALGRTTATLHLAGAAVAGTLLIAVPASAIYGIATSDAEPPRAEASLGGPVGEIRRGVEADLGHYHGLQPSHLALFPLAVVSSLVPPNPAVTRVGPRAADARISYLSRADALWPMGLAAALGLAGLSALAWRARAARPVVLGCAATLGAYGIVHLFYGDELFLYALHWQVPLLVLVGAAAAGARTTRAGVAALAVVIGVAGARSAIVIALVLRQWADVQGG